MVLRYSMGLWSTNLNPNPKPNPNFHGVKVFDGAVVTVTSCEITGTKKSGVSCSEFGTSVTVESSMLCYNDDAGVEVHDGGVGMVTSNLIWGNCAEGVKVDGESTMCTIDFNQIHENEIGVWGWRGALMSETGNSVVDNSREDFYPEDGCQVNMIPRQQPLPAFAGLKPRPLRNHWR